MIDDATLKEWRRLAEAAGDSPWYAREADGARYSIPARDGFRSFVTAVPPEHPCWKDTMSSWVGIGVWDNDGLTTPAIAKFIAASRAAVPALIAEVERLSKERDSARTALLRAQNRELAVCANSANEAKRQAEYNLARLRASISPVAGSRCTRCHRVAPNENGCALCNVPRLSERVSEGETAKKERDQLRAENERLRGALESIKEHDNCDYRFATECLAEARRDARAALDAKSALGEREAGKVEHKPGCPVAMGALAFFNSDTRDCPACQTEAQIETMRAFSDEEIGEVARRLHFEFELRADDHVSAWKRVARKAIALGARAPREMAEPSEEDVNELARELYEARDDRGSDTPWVERYHAMARAMWKLGARANRGGG